MTFTFEGESKEYIDTDITNKEFYSRMRQGAVAKTAAINTASFVRAFTPILEEGKGHIGIAYPPLCQQFRGHITAGVSEDHIVIYRHTCFSISF